MASDQDERDTGTPTSLVGIVVGMSEKFGKVIESVDALKEQSKKTADKLDATLERDTQQDQRLDKIEGKIESVENALRKAWQWGWKGVTATGLVGIVAWFGRHIT